jgi:hypothetical protein
MVKNYGSEPNPPGASGQDPRRNLDFLPGTMEGLDAIDLGCGTGYCLHRPQTWATGTRERQTIKSSLTGPSPSHSLTSPRGSDNNHQATRLGRDLLEPSRFRHRCSARLQSLTAASSRKRAALGDLADLSVKEHRILILPQLTELGAVDRTQLLGGEFAQDRIECTTKGSARLEPDLA